MIDFNPDKDLRKIREVKLDNNTLYVKQVDPFGFWFINFDKGQIPDKLKGAYTSFDEAMKYVNLYLIEKKREIKSVQK